MRLFPFIFILYFNQLNGQSILTKVDTTIIINGFLLEQSYQNPYGSTSFITFNLPVDATVKLFVKKTHLNNNDCQKDTVCIVYEGFLTKGFYKSTWDLKDYNNNDVENGFYDFHLIAETNGNDIYQMFFQGKTRIVVLR